MHTELPKLFDRKHGSSQFERETGAAEMNVKTIAGRLGERRTRFAIAVRTLLIRGWTIGVCLTFVCPDKAHV